MRNSWSSSARSGLGMSRMSSNDAAPRASQPHSCLRRYVGTSRDESHASSSLAEIERIGGRSVTRLRYRAFVNLFAFDVANLHPALVDQLLEMRAQRHLRGDHQLPAKLRPVDAPGQLLGGAASPLDLGKHLPLASEPVGAVLLDLRHRIGHRVPVPWKQHPGIQGCKALERAEVGRDVALWVSDHRAPAPEHEVSGEESTVVLEPEAQVIAAVPWRVQGSDIQVAHTHHATISYLREAPHRRAMSLRNPAGQ